MSETSTRDCDVLIIGGGPVGLTAALCLSKFGITSIVVERDAETSRAPKARAVNTRSMEIFRELGIEKALLREALPLESWRFLFCDEISGPEWARVEDPVDVSASASPTYRRTIMQSHVEAVLAAAVEASDSAEVLFATELRSLVQEKTSVVAHVYDANAHEERELRGRFMIGADGTQSVVRPMLGVGLPGESGLAFMATIHHRTQLDRWLADRPATLIMTTGAGAAPRITGVAKGMEEWVTMLPIGDTPGTRLEDLNHERCKEIVCEVVGADDIESEILHVGSFTINFQLATEFRRDRVFLAGDAAHRIPPAGGFGMNIGVQSAHNLAWKLAAVVHGEASEELLDTYDLERREVAQEVGDWSRLNGPRMGAILMARLEGDALALKTAAEEMEKYVCNIGMDLGVCYSEGALVSDGEPHPPLEPSVYRPSARAGARAPHCWLERDGESISTLDLFGRGFVLLGNAGAKDRESFDVIARESAKRLGVHLESWGVGADGDFEDPDSSFAKVYDIPKTGAVLVRPDGFVGWRTPEASPLTTESLTRALRQILYR
ncbi:MAG: FAD-dependent monooxygenase [Deltaproteobacteria bacterium]|nr:FAD-dependent monooxygenase [Deltaproteobacteria bacterium]